MEKDYNHEPRADEINDIESVIEKTIGSTNTPETNGFKEKLFSLKIFKVRVIYLVIAAVAVIIVAVGVPNVMAKSQIPGVWVSDTFFNSKDNQFEYLILIITDENTGGTLKVSNETSTPLEATVGTFEIKGKTIDYYDSQYSMGSRNTYHYHAIGNRIISGARRYTKTHAYDSLLEYFN